MFSLEKPKVYDRALVSVANLAQLSANWDKRRAVVDQLLRASESVVLNLGEVVKMLFGLRRSWEGDQLHEGRVDYEVQESWLFAHERLEAYQRSLRLVEWFHALPGGAELSSRWFRQIDKAVTSVVLNIAEGNGRRIEADHRQFLKLAESSMMKAGTYIQLCQRTGHIEAESAQRGLVLLDGAALLVRGLARSS
jgi:four helix bundle protein